MGRAMNTSSHTRAVPRILSIAGSDSSGGAGIQADIKTITMLGGYAMSAITAVTAQNTCGVTAIVPMSGEVVGAQITACLSDIGADAIKLGMLHDADIITHTARALEGSIAPVVIDPVMIATSGAALIAPQAIATLREVLFPRAAIITPNLPELSHLLGRKIEDSGQMVDGAAELAHMTGAAVLAKGGHTSDSRIIDVLFMPANLGEGERALHFEHERIDTPHTHGTGCTLSAAIAALLGHGLPMEHAVRLARHFVLQAIAAAPGFGAGNGPLGHYAVRKLG